MVKSLLHIFPSTNISMQHGTEYSSIGWKTSTLGISMVSAFYTQSNFNRTKWFNVLIVIFVVIRFHIYFLSIFFFSLSLAHPISLHRSFPLPFSKSYHTVGHVYVAGYHSLNIYNVQRNISEPDWATATNQKMAKKTRLKTGALII